MRYLVDTHVLLWILDKDKRVESLREELTDPNNQVFYSAISIWEIAIKHSKGKLKITPERTMEGAILQRFEELPLSSRHTALLSSIENRGNVDPFDNILVAQAKCEGFIFYTADSKILQYKEPCVRGV